MADIGVTLIRAADAQLDKVGQSWSATIRASFNWETGELFLRRGATRFELFHEMAHAKQWAEIEKTAYKELGKFARERHVFNEIRKHRSLFTALELSEATRQILRYRAMKRAGVID